VCQNPEPSWSIVRDNVVVLKLIQLDWVVGLSHQTIWKKWLIYFCVLCIAMGLFNTDYTVNCQIKQCKLKILSNAPFNIFIPHPINVPNYGDSSHKCVSLSICWPWHCISYPALFLPNLKLLHQKAQHSQYFHPSKLHALHISNKCNIVPEERYIAQNYIKR